MNTERLSRVPSTNSGRSQPINARHSHRFKSRQDIIGGVDPSDSDWHQAQSVSTVKLNAESNYPTQGVRNSLRGKQNQWVQLRPPVANLHVFQKMVDTVNTNSSGQAPELSINTE